jgi:hypothetical protein
VLTNKRQKPPPLSTRKSHIRNSNLSEEGSSWTEDNIFKEDDSFDEQHHHDNGFNFTSTPAVALINHDNNTVGLSTLNSLFRSEPSSSRRVLSDSSEREKNVKGIAFSRQYDSTESSQQMEDLKKTIQNLVASNERLEKQLAVQEEKSSRSSGDNKMGQHQLNNAPAPRRKPPLSSAMVPPPLSSSTVPNNNKQPKQEKRTQEADSDDQSSLAGSSVGSHRETRFERRGIFMGIRK